MIRASIDQDEFEVDNSDGLVPGTFEPTLAVQNDGNSSVNVTIAITMPEGEETGKTKEIYPHIFSDKSRRKDKGWSYYVQVDPEATHFYLSIDVNDSAFADAYTFQIIIETHDGSLDPIDVMVEVTPYNDISINLYSRDEEEILVRPGRSTSVTLVLTNRGNIFNEEVGVEVDYGGIGNLSVKKIMFPPGRRWINPESFGFEYEIIIGVVLEAAENSDDGRFVLDFFVVTPENEPPARGHRSVQTIINIEVPYDPREGDDPDGGTASGGDSESDEMDNVDYFLLEIVEILVIFTVVLWWKRPR